MILHKNMKWFLNGPIFEKILLLIVILNTIVLCFDGLFHDENTLKIQANLYLFFNILFVIEFAIKILIFGPKSNLNITASIN